MKTGFTLIELIVVIAIIAVLYGIILFSVTLYINKGKDSNISGSLAVLSPAGEVYYNGNNNSYSGFCNPGQNGNSVIQNIIRQMPQNSAVGGCYGGSLTDPTTWTSISNPAGVCCYVANDGNSWAACAREFTTPANYYCIDSRGMKKEETGTCNSTTFNLTTQCP